jgi:hypothetical protein
MAPKSVIPTTDTQGKTSSSTTSTRRVAQLTEHLAPAKETEQVNTRPTLPIEYPLSQLQLDPDHHIDDFRQLKVAVIGVCIFFADLNMEYISNCM